jgi:general secretion pathway protein L
MAEHLFIEIDDSANCVGAVVIDTSGHLIERPGALPLAELQPHARDRTLNVFVPSSEVFIAQAKIPRVSATRLRQMLPFALEDELAEDIEAIHFAAGNRLDDDTVAVAAVSRERLRFWRDALVGAGLRPAAMYSIAEGVQDTPGAVQLLLQGDSTFGRLPGCVPFNLEGLSLTDILALLRDLDDAPDLNHVSVHATKETIDSRIEELDALRSQGSNIDVRAFADGCLPHQALAVLTAGGANLLQGEFAVRSNLLALARPWKMAAALVITSILIALLAEGLTLVKLRLDDGALTAEAAEVCANDYSSAELNRCQNEMRRRLSEAGQSSTTDSIGFLEMLATFADAAGPRAELQALRYRDSVLDLELLVANVNELDAISQRVSESGRYSVNLLSNTPQDDGLRSRVQVVGGDQ